MQVYDVQKEDKNIGSLDIVDRKGYLRVPYMVRIPKLWCTVAIAFHPLLDVNS